MAGDQGRKETTKVAPSFGGRPTPNIVVGVDGSPGATLALDWAGAEAERAGARLTVVAACLYGGFGATTLLEEGARRVVEEAAERATEQHPEVDIQHEYRRESAAEALVGASRDADLLVVGSRGFGGFRGLLLGSVGQHCLTHASCSVAIIRAPKGERPDMAKPVTHQIVVGVDGSDESNRALEWAANEAHRTGAELEIVGSDIYAGASGFVFAPAVGVPDGAKQIVFDAVEHAARVAPEVVTRGVTSGDPPAAALVAASAHADLAVVGSRGLGAFRGLLLGSVSQHLANHASCSVVVVRAKVEPSN